MRKFVSFIVVGSFLWSGYVHASHHEEQLSSSSSSSSSSSAMSGAVQEYFPLEALPNEIVGMVIQQFCKRPDFKPADFKYIVNLAKTNRHFRDIVRAELPIYFKEVRTNALCSPPQKSEDVPEIILCYWDKKQYRLNRSLDKVIKDEHSSVESVQYLVALGAQINGSKLSGNLPCYPLHDVFEWGRLDIAGVLIEHGAFIMDRDSEQNIPLHSAAMNRSNAGVNFILESIKSYGNAGILRESINARNAKGETPLHIAAEYDRVENVRALLCAARTFGDLFFKGYINGRTTPGDRLTPLHCGVANNRNNKDVIQFLLENGADSRLKNLGCDRPSQLASDEGVKKLLEEHEALLDEKEKMEAEGKIKS